MFEFAKKVILKHVVGIPDGFRTEEAHGLFKNVKRIKLLSVEGNSQIGFPGLSRIGVGKTVELIPDMNYGPYGGGHTFRYEIEKDMYDPNDSVCHLDVGFVVRDGVREPKNYLRVTYDAPNPSFRDARRTVGRDYAYEYLGNDVVRACSDAIKVELKLFRD